MHQEQELKESTKEQPKDTDSQPPKEESKDTESELPKEEPKQESDDQIAKTETQVSLHSFFL